MELKDRIVTSIPVNELWTNGKVIKSKRTRYLDKNDIIAFLNNGPIKFVIADVGSKLLWVDRDNCFNFWKTEVREHLSDAEVNIKNLPEEWGYYASEWEVENTEFVVLLEKVH